MDNPDPVLLFLRDLIHELKDPFAAIHGGLGLTGQSALSQAERDYLQRSMQRNSQVVKRLLEDAGVYLSLLTRPGQVELKKVELRSLLEGAVKEVLPQLSMREQSVETAHLPKLWLSTDAAAVSRGVSCLLAALSRVSQRSQSFQMAVEGTGQESISVVLASSSPNLQLKEADFRAALARELARWLGGDTQIQAMGAQGLHLTFSFPLHEPQESPREPLKEAVVSGRLKNVLIVEDNPIALQVTARMLQNLGLSTREAGTAAEGLAEIARERPDLIICDLGLPGELDGYDLARRLRASESTRDLPLIALTGDAAAAREQALAAGFDQVLEKPLSETQLQELLEAKGLKE